MNNQIVEAALAKCQELLSQIIQGASSSPSLGKAPLRCYAALVNDYVEDPIELFARTNYKPVRNFAFGIDEIQELADMDDGPIVDPIDKRFFREGKFVLAISGDGRRCLIDFQVGPLFGSCLIYEVQLKDGKCVLNQVAIRRIS